MADEAPVSSAALQHPLTLVSEEAPAVEAMGVETVKIEHVFIQSD